MNKTVSIIIPCRNEENYIKQCIDSFLNQSYPEELIEIIIADGMSTDNTRGIINEMAKKHKNIVFILVYLSVKQSIYKNTQSAIH